MFPGQGAQFVGMCEEVCKDVPAAMALFDEASEILGYDLLEPYVALRISSQVSSTEGDHYQL